MTSLAHVVDEAAGTPVLVVGSPPPRGRDLDVLVEEAVLDRVRAALAAEGCVRRGRRSARLVPGAVESVELVPAASWGVSAADLAVAVAEGSPLPGFQNLRAPSPRHTLLLTARRLGHAGGLDERRRQRITTALAADPGAWVAAGELARQWHVAEALPALRQAYAGDGRVPASVLPRLVGERERGRGSSALVARLRARRPRRAGRGAVIAISGLDGSGKSTQAELLVATLRELDVDAVAEWRRLAQGSGLDAVARPVKRALRRLRPRAPRTDVPVHYSRSRRDAASLLRQRSALLTWLWSLVVTVAHIRDQRAAVLPHLRAGRVVVCDRYTLDSVVTLRFRYSAGRVQPWLVRRFTPRAVKAYYLDIPPAESLRRKDDGYALAQLETMHALYADTWAQLGVTRVDGTLPSDVIARQIADETWPALP